MFSLLTIVFVLVTLNTLRCTPNLVRALISFIMMTSLIYSAYGAPDVPQADVPVSDLPVSDRPKTSPRRALITGFYDWKSLGTPPEVRRCRDNPSCRVLSGVGVGPREFKGPLAKRLRALSAASPELQIDFALLPVTWGSASRLDLTPYHTVIHLGLGVYDTFHQIKIEVGAYNLRRGRDAMGANRDEPIRQGADSTLQPTDEISKGIERALKAKLPSPFRLVAVNARRDNCYLCNETYYGSLELARDQQGHQQRDQQSHQQGDQQSRLQEAYFIHIPHAEGDDDEPLSEALMRLIQGLTGR